MESLLDTAASFMDDLFDFSSDIPDEDEDAQITKIPSSFSLLPPTRHSFPEFVEEELEWISNKDAFPMVESFFDTIPNHPTINTNNYNSPVSVLDHSSSTTATTSTTSSSISTSTTPVYFTNGLKIPSKARSMCKRRRRRDIVVQKWYTWAQENMKTSKHTQRQSTILGRKCLHCGAEKTPQWRAGPLGPKTLCNACGVRFKSGRLVPEYRPASSPTFSCELHSNSHRKILEMRKQKMLTTTG